MVRLELDLFAGFSLRSPDGRSRYAIPTKKAGALLAWLAQSPARPYGRGELAALLWGERSERAARHSLSQALLSLKRAVPAAGASPIVADHRQVALAESAIRTDITRFRAYLAEGTPKALAAAAALYRGEFLAGFDGIGEAFDDWLQSERGQLREDYRSCLVRLLEHHRAGGRIERAIAYAQRLLDLDPLDETSHRQLMRLYLARGHKAAALRQYAICSGALRRELGIAPEEETTALCRSIRPPEQTPAKTTPPPGSPRPRIIVLSIPPGEPEPWRAELAAELSSALIVDLARFRAVQVSEGVPDGTAATDRYETASGLTFLVEARLHGTGNSFGIGIRLIAAASRRVLWAEDYRTPAGGSPPNVETVARTAAIAVMSQLDAAGIEAALRQRREDLNAYGWYLRGRYVVDRYDQNSVRKGLRCMRAAVDRDPGFALAWAHLALFKAVSGWWEVEPTRYLDEALQTVRSATEIDPYDAHCWGILALIRLYRREFREAEHSIEKALSLNRNLVFLPAYKATILGFVGRPKKALKLAMAAVDEAPATPNWLWETLSLLLYDLRRFDEAAQAIGRLSRLKSWNYLQLAACHGQVGRTTDALADWRAFAMLGSKRDPASQLREFYEDPAGHHYWLEGLAKAGLPVGLP